MEVVNQEYDRIHFELINSELVAHTNELVEESLSLEDDQSLAAQGYIIRRFDDYNYWVLSDRLDNIGMMVGIETLHDML